MGATSGAEVVTVQMPVAVWNAWLEHARYVAGCEWLDEEIRSELRSVTESVMVVETT